MWRWLVVLERAPREIPRIGATASPQPSGTSGPSLRHPCSPSPASPRPPHVTVIESADVTGVPDSPIKMWTLDPSVDKKDHSLVKSKCLQLCGEQDGVCVGGIKTHGTACNHDCASYGITSKECVDRACSEQGRLICEGEGPGLCSGKWCPRGPYLCSATYNEEDPSQPAACYLHNAAATEEALSNDQATTVVSPGKALMFTEMPILLEKSSTNGTIATSVGSAFSTGDCEGQCDKNPSDLWAPTCEQIGKAHMWRCVLEPYRPDGGCGQSACKPGWACTPEDDPQMGGYCQPTGGSFYDQESNACGNSGGIWNSRDYSCTCGGGKWYNPGAEPDANRKRLNASLHAAIQNLNVQLGAPADVQLGASADVQLGASADVQTGQERCSTVSAGVGKCVESSNCHGRAGDPERYWVRFSGTPVDGHCYSEVVCGPCDKGWTGDYCEKRSGETGGADGDECTITSACSNALVCVDKPDNSSKWCKPCGAAYGDADTTSSAQHWCDVGSESSQPCAGGLEPGLDGRCYHPDALGGDGEVCRDVKALPHSDSWGKEGCHGTRLCESGKCRKRTYKCKTLVIPGVGAYGCEGPTHCECSQCHGKKCPGIVGCKAYQYDCD